MHILLMCKVKWKYLMVNICHYAPLFNVIYVDQKVHLNGIILKALFQDDVQTVYFAYNFV